MDAAEWHITHKKGAGRIPKGISAKQALGVSPETESMSDKKLKELTGVPTRIAELREIRDLVRRVAEHRETGSQDAMRVYKMFGSLSPDELRGVVIGMTFVMSVVSA